MNMRFKGDEIMYSKSRYEHNIPKLSIEACWKFADARRSAVARTSRLYLIKTYPIVFKEVVTPTFKDEKIYRFLTFVGTKYIAYYFDHKPRKNELDEMWNDIENELKSFGTNKG